MSIAENRRARFDYHLEEKHEAGMVLEGWEIKAIRAGQVQLTDGYVVIRDGELYLIGCRINALRSASTHVNPEADRTKKLLMHKEEIKRLIGKVEQKGFTLVEIAIVLVIIGLWVRLRIGETPAFRAALEREPPARVPLLRSPTSSCS